MGKRKPVTVTFKESEQDLYDYTVWHNSPAAWIKDLIKSDMEKEDKNKPNTPDISMFD